MSYKCPFCLYSFNKSDAKLEMVNERVPTYYCPNTSSDPKFGRPECGKMLPSRFFQADSKVISLMGGQFVGKTAYSVALLIQLRTNPILAKLGIFGELIGDDITITRINDTLRRILSGEELTASLANIGRESIVIRLMLYRDGVLKHIYLSFFDNPGEANTGMLKLMNNRNFLEADGILYLFEPNQFSHLRSYLPGYNDRIAADLYTTLINMLELMRSVFAPPFNENMPGILRSFERDNRIRIPMGMVMTKIDQIYNNAGLYIPDDLDELEAHVTGSIFDRDIINQISADIEVILCDNPGGDTQIRNLMNGFVKNYKFFGVKSIDVDKRTGRPLNKIAPRGVVLPILWLLNELNICNLYDN